MSLIPRNSFFDDNFFDRFFTPAATESGSFFTPKIDISEKEGNYLVTAEIPGVKKEDIHVHLEDGVLSIEAESKQEDKEEKDGKVIRQERRYGKYMRSFNVGNGVKESDINANYSDGVLTLSLPKAGEEEPARKRIEIG